MEQYNGKSGNVAVFEYEETIEGKTSLKTATFHAHDGLHSEEHGLEALKGKNITRAYSERHPCGPLSPRTHGCQAKLLQKAPNAKYYHSIPYYEYGH